MVDGNAGKGDFTPPRTNQKAYQAGWDRLNRAIKAEKRKKKKKLNRKGKKK